MRPSQRTTIIAAGLYVVVLTNVLLAPHPLWMFGLTGDAVEESLNSALADYIQHGLSYTLLTVLLIAAVRPRTVRGLTLCVALTLAHGLGTEALQAVIPLRDCEWSDALADSIGAVTGLAISASFVRVWAFRSRRSTAT